MSTISLRLTNRDYQLIKKYAEINNVSMSKLLRDAVIEKIEDELDLLLFDEAVKQAGQTYNLAGLYVETGQFDRALQCIADIEDVEMDEVFKERLDYIRDLAEQRLTPEDYADLRRNYYMQKFDEDLRMEVEEKRVTPESTLNRGLKNMPNEWLLNMCAVHEIGPCRQRPQREKAITAHLTDPAHLKKAVQKLTRPEQELLYYLLGKGGWARLSAVSRKFGKMEGDGFYWDEEEPQSTTGRLWSKGMIMVGKAILNNRQVKIAAIPIDLRPLLEEIL